MRAVTQISRSAKSTVIKGVSKGTCYVYDYTQYGVMAKIKVIAK